MDLENLQVYQLSQEIGNETWTLAQAWDYFTRDTIGKQLVRASDSIAANISEGFGRFHFRENKQFVYYARGSLYETQTWLTKAHQRQLIDEQQFHKLKQQLKTLGIKLNRYINSIGSRKNNDQ